MFCQHLGWADPLVLGHSHHVLCVSDVEACVCQRNPPASFPFISLSTEPCAKTCALDAALSTLARRKVPLTRHTKSYLNLPQGVTTKWGKISQTFDYISPVLSVLHNLLGRNYEPSSMICFIYNRFILWLKDAHSLKLRQTGECNLGLTSWPAWVSLTRTENTMEFYHYFKTRDWVNPSGTFCL